MKFEKEFIIYYHDTDYLNKLKLTSLMNYFQEIAFLHLKSINAGMDTLKENQETWMIYRYYIKIEQSPKWQDKLFIETWLSQAKSFKGTREFEVKNSNNDIIAKAKSISFLIDTVKMKPKKIDSQNFDTSILNPRQAIEYVPSNFSSFDNYEHECTFNVRQNDIDTNGHVNNIIYADWFLEAIYMMGEKNYSIKELEILYKKEIRYGQKITVKIKKIEESSAYVTYNGQISNEDHIISAIIKGKIEKAR
ncbi:hypothetical protein SYNTR_1492 [Candidatus Syntrophocurvum alkaliphilum]|uniref:Acyl-ACP thioesterase n=1 Tax=Candidatus Syntrophocurvum alkaliphilum TaxID=2293317 RepID=A0A6I6DBT9_9FIRM|nr:acyl-ACP thioesterase domain-containing protein [Candidatus Syntrophocurvum alkaliphilum]QGU00086.1 hypothetical protein SYNTR_1492 [Candidatus Syntrophocurvum alkaliphilum]